MTIECYHPKMKKIFLTPLKESKPLLLFITAFIAINLIVGFILLIFKK